MTCRDGATPGPVQVVTPGGTLTSNVNFRVNWTGCSGFSCTYILKSSNPGVHWSLFLR